MREQPMRSVILVAALCGACASGEVDSSSDQRQARLLIQESTGRSEVFDPDAALISDEAIQELLADGLGLDEALRLALLNSRRLQAGFLGLGVARADFVQAGLLRNPSLGISLLLPSGGGRPKLSGELMQSVVDLWELPARQDVARSVLDQRILELSRFAGELVADTKDAYVESVAARDLLATSRESARNAAQSLEAVQRRVQGGVASSTEESLAKSRALSAELELRRAERDSFDARRRLAALLSLESDLMEVAFTDGLPPAVADGLDRESLAARARSTRLDIRAAEAAVHSADAQLALERRRVVPEFDVGLSAERPEGSSSVDLLAGPGASIELPIFDRNQARIRRAQFHRDQLAKECEALALEVAQQVRAAVDRAESAARTARFVTDELVPQAERGAELMRTAYELGDATLIPLLESQRAALEARRSRIEALLEAARAQVDVERSAGASMSVLLARESARD